MDRTVHGHIEMTTPWLKVTHLAAMPGRSKVSRWPKRGTADSPGRWIVFDKAKAPNPGCADALADFDTFEDAAEACQAMRTAPQ